MHQRWTYRCYPTAKQEKALARTFGCVRYVYNWALAERSKAYKAGNRMTYADSDRALTQLKRQKETIWLNEVASVPLQQSLRDLQSAYSSFYAKQTGYPSFKRRSQRATARYSKSAFWLVDNRVSLAKVGRLKVKWDRELPSKPNTVTVIREADGRYYVSFIVEVDVIPLPSTGESIGIDFGVSRLATLSTGESIANPRHGSRRAKRLAFLQRNLARKKAGSRRRFLAKRALARQCSKIGNARRDTLHKLTTRLIRENDVIFIEDLHLRGMTKNHSLARNLSDASIGTAIRMLEEKAERYGRKVIKIDRFFPSSKMCSTCGHINSALSLSIREWSCHCGAHHDRDHNAALNILAVGQTVAAHGDGVRAA